MNILSLFDGMSCGQIALEKVGIKVERYYASELDKYAIQVTQKNYPNTVQLGDVTKWQEWDIDWSSIDLLQGGSPCQGFSFAGKQLAFDDPRSKLFFVYVDILNHIKKHNPNVKFLLENVRMKKEYLNVISGYLGVQPVLINSALVSAQNRHRYYWTNICEIKQPEDKGILLKDILQPENEVDEQYYMSPEWNIWWSKNADFQLQKKYSTVDADKAITMTARQYASWNGNFVQRLGHYNNGGQGDRIYSTDGKSVTLSALGGGRDAKTGLYLIQRPRGKNKGGIFPEKSPTISSNSWEHNNLLGGERIRKLTPIECERLQNVPDSYTSGVSNSQRYKMLGNGWTVDVICHIYSGLQ